MKALYAVAAIGLSLMVPLSTASAQRYGGQDYGYGGRGYDDRDRDDDYRGRGYGRRGDDDGYRDRGPRYRERSVGFDEREYLRCNPDVRQAVRRGQMASGYVHYQYHGRREGRRLSC